jgi:hypothetical protein
MRSLRRGRTVHLVDIENLAGVGLPSLDEVQLTMRAYQAQVRVGPVDQFVVGVNHSAVVTVGVVCTGVQLLVRSGENGADSVLDEAARLDRVDLRFERVVIGSGDGYFGPLADWLIERGLPVTVVSRPGQLNRRLGAIATDIVYLRPFGDVA